MGQVTEKADDSDDERMASIQEDDAEDWDESKSPSKIKVSPPKKRANQVYDVGQNSARKSSGAISSRSNGTNGSSSARKRQLSHFDLQDEYIKFKDFSEPNIIKTGYLIPLKCGHNGNMSLNERTIYEIHLANAGFI